MTADDPRRLIPYLRQSLARIGETRDSSLSLEAQLQIITDWGESNGYAVEPAIRDHDVRGDDPLRPGLAEMAERAQPGVTIAVYRWDRLARDIALQEMLIRQHERQGAAFVSVTEPSTPFPRQLYGAMNEEFSRVLRERMQGIKRNRAARGHHNGNLPYGYQHAGTRMVPLPNGDHIERPSGPLVPSDYAPHVAEAYQRIAAGERLFAVVSDFAQRGIPTMRGGPWTVTTLRRILTNPVYRGDVVHRGDVVATDAHPALVDRDTWQQANDLLSRRHTRQKRHNETSWLEGLVRHSCGAPMYLMRLQHHRNRQHYSAHFACQTAYTARKCGQPRRHISKRKLEAAALACLTADLSAVMPLVDALCAAERVAGGKDTADTYNRLQDRRAAIVRRYDRIRDAWASGVESLDWLQDAQTQRDVQLAAVDAELAALPQPPDPAVYAQAHAWLSDVATVLAVAGDDDLAALLAALGVVVVSADGVRVEYRPDVARFVTASVVVV